LKYAVAIESNTLSYLAEAMLPGYDPKDDNPALAKERISMIRIFLYTGITYHVLPTVHKEYSRIVERKTRKEHQEIAEMLCFDHWEFDQAEIKLMKNRFLTHHNQENDCKILAEAEAAGMDILLSFDKRFINKLVKKTEKVKIMKPTDFWDLLNIQLGTKPKLCPSRSNPLSQKTWWQI
jgi:predicted nucleic acid-binding protein